MTTEQSAPRSRMGRGKAADTIVVVKRKRMEDFGTIVATGRDIPEAEVAVRFDGMLWHEAPSALSGASFERSEVYRVIEDSGPIFPAAIAKQLGMSRQSVQNIVARLEEGGAVERVTEGWIAPSRKPSRARTGIPHVSSVSERHQRHVGHEGVQSVTEAMASIFGGVA